MRDAINSFFSNDSVFGRLMTKIGIIIGANLMFVLFSIPVVTIGASYVALYHVMLKTLRGNGVVNPFKQFWIGFKTNFKHLNPFVTAHYFCQHPEKPFDYYNKTQHPEEYLSEQFNYNHMEIKAGLELKF